MTRWATEKTKYVGDYEIKGGVLRVLYRGKTRTSPFDCFRQPTLIGNRRDAEKGSVTWPGVIGTLNAPKFSFLSPQLTTSILDDYELRVKLSDLRQR